MDNIVLHFKSILQLNLKFQNSIKLAIALIAYAKIINIIFLDFVLYESK